MPAALVGELRGAEELLALARAGRRVWPPATSARVLVASYEAASDADSTGPGELHDR